MRSTTHDTCSSAAGANLQTGSLPPPSQWSQFSWPTKHSSESRNAILHQRSSDHHFVDLGRTIIDPKNTGIAVETLHDELFRISHSPKNLDAAIDDAAKHLRCVELDRGYLFTRIPALIDLPGGVQHHHTDA